MGQDSKIEWCHHTFNPWWGCTKVSPGCTNCYAEVLSKRFGDDVWGPRAPRKMMSDAHWRKPLSWDRAAAKAGERRRVFCASMADVFEDRADLAAPRERLWELIEWTPNLDWLLLTKRPQNIAAMLPRGCGVRRGSVWLGVTAEDQHRADERIPLLLEMPAAVRFVSYEPDLGPLNLRWEWSNGLDWVIAGAESGTGWRPMDLDWVRSIRDQCARAGISFFFKQKLDCGRKVSLPELDGRVWDEVPL